jgi:DNA-binding CsgD family transcriptional regulator
LRSEIGERKRAEGKAKKSEKKLRQQADRLEKVNTALKVLLEHREEERRTLEESVLLNVRKLVIPYMDQLEKANLEAEKKPYLDIVRSNLENLISPFTSSLSSKYLSLTPMEIQIADLVKQGQSSKEIASFLNVSHDTVMFHRKNIRKKLGLANKKANLRSFLQTLAK